MGLCSLPFQSFCAVTREDGIPQGSRGKVAERGFEDMNYQGEDGEIEFRSAGVDYQKQKQSNLFNATQA